MTQPNTTADNSQEARRQRARKHCDTVFGKEGQYGDNTIRAGLVKSHADFAAQETAELEAACKLRQEIIDEQQAQVKGLREQLEEEKEEHIGYEKAWAVELDDAIRAKDAAESKLASREAEIQRLRKEE